MNLWPNQLEEAAMIAGKPFAFIAADMGTGKSAAAIEGLRQCGRVLIVCPIAVGPAWVKQFSLWDNTRDVCLAVDGSAARRAASISATGERCAVIVNYDAVWRGAVGKAVNLLQWDAIVLDESHKIKSPSGRASRWLAKLAASQPEAKRVCMTGTPTPHSPLDWWAQFRFLDPSILGSTYTGYRSRIAITHPRYPGWVKSFKTEALDALSRRIDPHVYRIKADDVLTLPDILHVDVPLRLSPANRKYYDRLEDDLVSTLESGETVTAANKLVVVTRLQQATSGFAVDESGETVQLSGDNPKAEAIAELLESLPTNEPIVIFCKFVHDIQVCQSVLDRLGISHSELSGRKKSLDTWQRGDTIALVVQQQAGGVGVDCTRAAYAVYFSLSHSLGDFEQSLARLRRPGQNRPCRFYHLICEDTVDATIYGALQSKRDVTEEVLKRLQRRAIA
jgi:SNF2 family DNA or RNA helicase